MIRCPFPTLHTKFTANMSEATPRITAQYLEQFSHKIVCLVGKVTQLRGETAIVDADGQITVHLNRVSEAHSPSRRRLRSVMMCE